MGVRRPETRVKAVESEVMITWKHAKPSNRLGSLGSIATSAPYLGGVGPLD